MKRILLAGLLLHMAACGGTSRNAALKNRVSDVHLAPVSASERAAESEAYQDVFLAEWQLAFTKGQIEGAELEIKIAKNNLASAKLGVKSAELEKKAADDTGDMNRVKSTDRAGLLAEQELEVHRLAIDRAKQSLAYLKKRLIYEESQHRSLEAKLELARAESLNAAGIQPPDFDKKTYKSQHAQRASQAKSNKAAVDAEHKQLTTIDAQLNKAKMTVEAIKNPGAAGAGADSPTGPEPTILPPPPADTDVPTPAESLPGDTTTKPDADTKPEKPAGEPEPGEPEPGAERKPTSEQPKDATPAAGGQS